MYHFTIESQCIQTYSKSLIFSNEEIQRNASIDKSIGSKNGDWFDALQYKEKHFENRR